MAEASTGSLRFAFDIANIDDPEIQLSDDLDIQMVDR